MKLGIWTPVPHAIAPEPRLHEQIQRIHITQNDLSLDDLSRLWTMLQTPYRLSVAYEVRAVVIEAERPAVVPLPVARRNIGVGASLAQAGQGAHLPRLLSIVLPNGQIGWVFRETVGVPVSVIEDLPIIFTPR